jgi:hypothetical protein
MRGKISPCRHTRRIARSHRKKRGYGLWLRRIVRLRPPEWPKPHTRSIAQAGVQRRQPLACRRRCWCSPLTTPCRTHGKAIITLLDRARVRSPTCLSRPHTINRGNKSEKEAKTTNFTAHRYMPHPAIKPLLISRTLPDCWFCSVCGCVSARVGTAMAVSRERVDLVSPVVARGARATAQALVGNVS